MYGGQVIQIPGHSPRWTPVLLLGFETRVRRASEKGCVQGTGLGCVTAPRLDCLHRRYLGTNYASLQCRRSQLGIVRPGSSQRSPSEWKRTVANVQSKQGKEEGPSRRGQQTEQVPLGHVRSSRPYWRMPRVC